MPSNIDTSANRQWLLAKRPIGEPNVSDFEFVTSPLPDRIRDGEVMVKNHYLSLDPYMRWRMNAGKSYAPPVEINQVMVGATVGEVVSSSDAGFAPGDWVIAGGGWQDYAVSPAARLRKIQDKDIPESSYLGILGSPGFTAYAGLMKIGMPKAGETVVVGAATGPVGSMVGQLARFAGCRTVAIAGGTKKCDFAIETFGFDAAVDHRSPDFEALLAKACPEGIDVYFENIGGKVFEAVLPLLNDFARIPVCGLISQYNLDTPSHEGIPLARFMQDSLVKRLHIQGFIVTDFIRFQSEFLEMATPLFKSGKLVQQEDIVSGLEQAPEAFIKLLNGKNFGKLVVRIS